MTARQRAELLALPDTEAAVVRHYGLDAEDLAAVAAARTPATRLGYALQLCALRYPGRHLRRGELLPASMLDHIAEQVGVDAGVIADFARRTPTRYDQLAAIKARFGFRDLSRPLRIELMTWLTEEAPPIIDGRVLVDRLLGEMRSRRIVIPGASVVERMAAEAMHRADAAMVGTIDADFGGDMRARLDALIDDKVHERQSRLSWLRDPGLRRAVTAELNKAEARNGLARAVAFHRLGRFRDRGLENQKTRAVALNLVTAAIILFNCRYLGRALDELRRQGRPIDPTMQAQLLPLGWDRINLTGDYVWSDRLDLGADGLMPLLDEPYRESVSR